MEARLQWVEASMKRDGQISCGLRGQFTPKKSEVFLFAVFYLFTFVLFFLCGGFLLQLHSIELIPPNFPSLFKLDYFSVNLVNLISFLFINFWK